jgi:hypothetical protein
LLRQFNFWMASLELVVRSLFELLTKIEAQRIRAQRHFLEEVLLRYQYHLNESCDFHGRGGSVEVSFVTNGGFAPEAVVP